MPVLSSSVEEKQAAPGSLFSVVVTYEVSSPNDPCPEVLVPRRINVQKRIFEKMRIHSLMDSSLNRLVGCDRILEGKAYLEKLDP